MNDKLNAEFSIDRADKKCRTPTRNKEILASISYYQEYFTWSSSVTQNFSELFSVGDPVNYKMLIDTSLASIFVPLVPLFKADHSGNDLFFSIQDTEAFILEQKGNLRAQLSVLQMHFTNRRALLGASELFFNLILQFIATTNQFCRDGVYYIEYLLESQLTEAIGKHITPLDFFHFMKYFNRKLFKPSFQPVQFSHSIRNLGHSPEGFYFLPSSISPFLPSLS